MWRLFILIISMAWPVFILAQDISLPDHPWTLSDISSRDLKSEQLFKGMNRSLVRLKDSICSNRAQVWAYDFKRKQEIDTGKIFLFFTLQNGQYGSQTWWYHVSPVVNESGNVSVLDAGFPHLIDGPLKKEEWFKVFTRQEQCRELRLGENELIEKIYNAEVFPEISSHGKFDCYYHIAPAGYWTPYQLGLNLLGYDEDRNPVNFIRSEINEDEVYWACLEASTTPMGWTLGLGRKKCQKYMWGWK